jgi:hypothetical protein
METATKLKHTSINDLDEMCVPHTNNQGEECWAAFFPKNVWLAYIASDRLAVQDLDYKILWFHKRGRRRARVLVYRHCSDTRDAATDYSPLSPDLRQGLFSRVPPQHQGSQRPARLSHCGLRDLPKGEHDQVEVTR